MDVWRSGTFPSKSRQLVHIVLQQCVECKLYALTTDIGLNDLQQLSGQHRAINYRLQKAAPQPCKSPKPGNTATFWNSNGQLLGIRGDEICLKISTQL